MAAFLLGCPTPALGRDSASKSGQEGATQAPATSVATDLNTKNFVSCSLTELQRAIPKLKGLKPAKNQDGLSELLDKIGSKTVELYQNVPNLSSKEKLR